MASDLQNAIAVNQKLGFARVLIEAARKLANDDSIPARQAMHAFLDGACGQLHDALIHFVFEVAESQNQQPNIERTSLARAVEQCKQQAIENDLLQEVALLLKAPSWLSDLVECKINPQSLAARFNTDAVNRISAASQTPSLLASDKQSPIGPLPTLQSWLINIQNLIERQRNQALEE